MAETGKWKGNKVLVVEAIDAPDHKLSIRLTPIYRRSAIGRCRFGLSYTLTLVYVV